MGGIGLVFRLAPCCERCATPRRLPDSGLEAGRYSGSAPVAVVEATDLGLSHDPPPGSVARSRAAAERCHRETGGAASRGSRQSTHGEPAAGELCPARGRGRGTLSGSSRSGARRKDSATVSDLVLILHPLFKCAETKNSGIPMVCDTDAPGAPAPPERGRCVDPQRESGTAPGALPARRAGGPRESSDG